MSLTATPPPTTAPAERDQDKPISDQLADWLEGDGEHTLGGLADVFEEKSFALIFILLLGVSALPLPTGGATHVFEIIAVIVAAQLVIGRDKIWIPKRWQGLELAGGKRQRFIEGLLKFIRFLERFSKPRLTFLFDHRLSNSIFGLLVIGLTAGAFFAPPFSGLDTLPSLGVVLLSVAVLLEDFALVVVGLVVGVAGVVLEIVLGKAAAGAFKKLF
ncbi:MAG: exopolysaccharide biosynthesis protein [Solirubrobacteraceae bacterium]